MKKNWSFLMMIVLLSPIVSGQGEKAEFDQMKKVIFAGLAKK